VNRSRRAYSDQTDDRKDNQAGKITIQGEHEHRASPPAPGPMSSLTKSFIASAIGCSQPCGHTRFGARPEIWM